MRHATALKDQTPDAAANAGRAGRTIARLLAPTKVGFHSGANDADFGAAAAGVAATPAGSASRLASPALAAAARSHRVAGLAATQRALLAAAVDRVARLRPPRQPRATGIAAQSLDVGTLRDLGLDRREALSASRAIENAAAATRALGAPLPRGR